VEFRRALAALTPVLAALLAAGSTLSAAGVRVWEATLPLRTTVEGKPNPNPPFDVFQTTKFNYPYTLRENLTGEEKEVAWRAVFLENEYLKCSVLPDLGGHLYTCVDKVSGEPMFYANPTIKKAQIGYRGAWAAFGIEFNFPVSHNWVSLSPVPYSTATHPDGSASILVGNIDRPYGMQWTVELLLRPGSAVLEQRVTLYNRSDVRHRYYWWNNAGVRVWDDSRIWYPMRWTASHGFTDVNTWPVASDGIDYSVIKNQVKGPVSSFVHGSREPFMGVYHPHTNTGVAHYAEYGELPGKKIWSWGVDADGLDWRRALSDDNSAYVEVQAGLMRNQETYAFLQPRQTIRFTEYWMPVRAIGGIARANLAGVLNLERKGDRLVAGFNANTVVRGAKIRLLEGSHVLEEVRADLVPDRTWSHEIAARAGKVTFELSDSSGRVLMRQTEGEYDWSPESEIREGPQARVAPTDALEIGTDQELNGRLVQAYDTYSAALHVSPQSQALRVAAGRLAVTLLRYADGIRWLVPAQEHATFDPEIAYYLGLAYVGGGQARLARTQFETAYRMPEFRAAGALQLAELSAREGDRPQAIAYLREALRNAPDDQRAAEDIAMLERSPRTGFSPTEPGGDAERLLATATSYMRLGLWREALDLLSRDYPEPPAEQREPGVPAPKQHAMVAYYRAYCRQKLGEAHDYAAASKLSARYVFPNGAQTLAVLEAALAARPDDATARYFLGNLRLQAGMVTEAIAEWQTARRLDPQIPVLHASLGRTLLRLSHDTQGAFEAFQAGLAADPQNAELYDGVATTSAILGRPAAERTAALERYPDPANMPTSLVYDLALSYAEAGTFEKAAAIFRDRFFPREEGGTNVRQIWIRVRALEAESKAVSGQCKEATAILDHLKDPVEGLAFTRDGLDVFIDQALNQVLFLSVESRCGRNDAAARRSAALARRSDLATLVFTHASAARLQDAIPRQISNSSWNATMAGLIEIELGHPDNAIPLLETALLLPDRNLSHHLSRVALAQIKR
jgi:tetratricopeptide (TPR) repeat protein